MGAPLNALFVEWVNDWLEYQVDSTPKFKSQTRRVARIGRETHTMLGKRINEWIANQKGAAKSADP